MTTKVALPRPKYTVTADARHRYTIQHPERGVIGPLLSVTTVLNVIDKPKLKGWAARMAADYFKKEILRLGKKALTPEALDEIAVSAANAHTVFAKDAANLGSICHDAFEAIVLGKEPAPPPPEIVAQVEPAIRAFKAYRLQSDIEIVATELAVGSVELSAGGRLDWLGWSKSRGWGIGDYKTSTGFYGNEYAYQAGGGYALMVEEMYGIEIAWSEIVRFSKKPPYESEARPVTDIAAAKAGFRNALALVRSNQANLIGAPIYGDPGVVQSATTAPEASATTKGKKVAAAGF